MRLESSLNEFNSKNKNTLLRETGKPEALALSIQLRNQKIPAVVPVLKYCLLDFDDIEPALSRHRQMPRQILPAKT